MSLSVYCVLLPYSSSMRMEHYQEVTLSQREPIHLQASQDRVPTRSDPQKASLSTHCTLRMRTDTLGVGWLLRNVTILEGGEFVKGFHTECGGINQGGNPRVPMAPEGCPRA